VLDGDLGQLDVLALEVLESAAKIAFSTVWVSVAICM